MDEIADLIRLLAEAPAEEAPMYRPKEFLDRLAIEKVAQEGIHPEGPAVPDADAKPNEVVPGIPPRFNLSPPGEYKPANPDPATIQFGAVADPKTGVPDIGMPVRTYTSETFMGMVATPKILDAIAGMPASPQEVGDRIGIANPSPRSEVTITVPPAFPMDPKEAFSMVDEQLSLPPQQEPKVFREISANTEDLVLESTEALVARSYQALEGARSDIDRWSL